MTIDLNDELVQDFLVESEETVELLSEKLVELEQSPDDIELLNMVFRSFHNIKGGGGFLGLDELVRVCHSAEEIFDRLRTGQRTIDGALMDAILEATDVVAEMIVGIRQGIEPPPADPELLQRLAGYASLQPNKPQPGQLSSEQQQSQQADSEPPGVATVQADIVTLQTPESVTVPAHEAEFSLLADAYVEPGSAKEVSVASVQSVSTSPESPVDEGTVDTSDAANDEISDDEFDALLDQLPGLRGGDMKSQETVEAAHATHDQTRSDKELGDLLRNVADPPQANVADPPQASVIRASPQPAEGAADTVMPTDHQEKKQKAVAPASAHPAEVADSTIRVDTKGLDDIMNMVGELVLARNRLSTLDADLGNEHLTQAVNNLSLVASDLQTLVMKTRMQPIKKAFGRFPRVVRDLARILNKEVLLEMEGEDTALDKTLVDALADPLVHLVRNSVDHGIEMPAQRAAAGKPRCGRVRLMASQKGDHIQVGVADDGVGLDAEKLRKKALDKGLISVEAAARMSREECFNLIFMPGFTTMDVASNVSGRGVGMDVVKTRIGQFNGSVSIESELGAGTVIYIKVPLTLAIMPTLMVKVAGHIFAIPLLSILEILEYDETRTKRVDGQKVFILQDKVVPVYSLRDWLTTDSLAPPSQQAHLVLVSLGSARYGLIVDDLVGQEEVVIKPLGKLLHGTPGLVGATITGDGEIALILDILGLITHYASLSNIQVA